MHVVSVKALREFWERHADSESALRAWFHEAKVASWKSFGDIKTQYNSADCLPGNRVVFDIKGNHYRLVVLVSYVRVIGGVPQGGRVFVRFVGTHAEYDKIDAETI